MVRRILVSMRCRFLLVALVLATVACHRDGGKPLAGEWYGENKDVKSQLKLASDGTFSLFGANQFAAGIAAGTYTQTGDHLDLALTQGSAGRLSYTYRWIGPDMIGLKMEAAGMPEEVYKRTGPAPSSAGIPKMSPGEEKAAKASAEATTCLSNVKQLAMGMALYAQDFDGTLPSAATWASNLLPYVKNQAPFTCPALAKTNEVGGYAMDSRLDQVKTATIPDPRSTVMIFESLTKQIGASDPQTTLLMAPRHGDRIAIGFADGTARGIKR